MGIFYMRPTQFINDGVYHIYNRGVDKRNIFEYDYEFAEFISLLNKKQIYNNLRSVEILSFCLLKNHFHLIIRQLQESGIAKFMQRIGISYTKSFNKRNNKRSGALFESTYKAKPVINDSYLLHLFRYVHLNPLQYFQKDWKERGINDIDGAFKFLNQYMWSNYPNLFTNDKESLVKVNESIIEKEFKNKFSYNGFLNDWLCFGMPENLVL